MSRIRLLAFVALLFLPVSSSAQLHRATGSPMGSAVTITNAQDPLAITFAEKKLTVTNATPAGRVLLLAVDRQPAVFLFAYAHYALVTEEKGSKGTVSFDLGANPGTSSVWIVADLPTGRTAVARPSGSPYQELALPLRRGTNSGATFETPGSVLDIVVLRPGIGAWFRSAGDGAAGDAGPKADRKITFDVSALEPFFGTSAAAGDLHPHDLVIGIDEDTQKYFVTEVQP